MKRQVSRSPVSPGIRDPRAGKEGAALIITLSILVLLSIVIVGMATTTRTERGASSSHLERFRAELMAKEATESIIALFNSQTSNAAGYWATRPGALFTSPASSDDNSTDNALNRNIPLSSGISTLAGSPNSKTASDNPAILNIQKLLTPAGATPDRVVYNPAATYDPSTDGMKLSWVYVHQNGDREWTENPDTADDANPVVGRYAFWVDDESSKINYNTAYSRAAQLNLSEQNRTPMGDPANVSLDALPELDSNAATQIKAERDSQPFNSPEEAKRIANEAITQSLQDNKFDVTHYGNTPNMTFFNEPKIVLTTQEANINPSNLDSIQVQQDNTGDGIPYLDILDPGKPQDPWDTDNLDKDKVERVVAKLNDYLKNDGWPFVGAGGRNTFQQKYYEGVEGRLTQLALNIIEYVRSRETTRNWVVPIRGTVTSTGAFTFNKTGTPSGIDAILGLPRTPRINEIGLYVNSLKHAKLYLEIHLPKHFGFDDTEGVDLNGMPIYADFWALNDQNESGTHLVRTKPQDMFTISSSNTRDENDQPSTMLKPGGYLVLRDTLTNQDGVIVPFNAPKGTRPTKFACRVAISTTESGTLRRLDITPLSARNSGVGDSDPALIIQGTVDDSDVTEANISSVEVDDPRVSAHADDWAPGKGNGGGKQNTFGETNSRYLDLESRIDEPGEPQQDTDDGTRGGALTDASLVMPHPKDTQDPPRKNHEGKVTSVGELGFIHTGMKSAGGKGISWRTLRLQPSDFDDKVVPDWALLDLFAVPPPTPNDGATQEETKRLQELYNPHHATASAGRININATIDPFTSLQRQASLKALLINAPKDFSNPDMVLSEADAEDIARHIYNLDYSPKGGDEFGTLAGIYDSPGEVVEIEGVADNGEAGEELVRQILGLITTRSNVFTIYAVGQALRQDPDGHLVVTAEERNQAMIERYSTVVTDRNTEVKYRTVYNRSLTP